MSVTAWRWLGPMPYRQVWFATKIKGGLFPPARFMQSSEKTDDPRYVRKDFVTLVTDLGTDLESVFAQFKSTVRNEIRQAESAGVRFAPVPDPAVFVAYYNQFCKERGIKGTTLSKATSLGSALVCTQASQESRVLAMHAYIVDPSIGRARLLWSASSRFDDSIKTLVAKANRWLHHADMGHLKSLGCTLYDWGGIDPVSQDPGIMGINRFKEAFGGTVLTEWHYSPRWLGPLGGA